MSVTQVSFFIGIHIFMRIAVTFLHSQPQLPHGFCGAVPYRGALNASASAVRGTNARTFSFFLVRGYAMLVRPNKAETVIHGCNCSDDMAVRMHKVMAIPRSCVV